MRINACRVERRYCLVRVSALQWIDFAKFFDGDLGDKKIRTKILADLCSTNEQVKWGAVITLGAQISRLAEKKMEAARNMMRRFMWQLNDECGGIGWGIPEVMGEVMARNEDLAREFAPILVSYIRKDGNYLEFEPLQRGAIWAIGRLGLVRPQILQGLGAASYLLPFLNSPDAAVRGLAAWVSGLLEATEAETDLKGLANDLTPVRVFVNGEIFRLRISDLAKESLFQIRNKKPRFYPE